MERTNILRFYFSVKAHPSSRSVRVCVRGVRVTVRSPLTLMRDASEITVERLDSFSPKATVTHFGVVESTRENTR